MIDGVTILGPVEGLEHAQILGPCVLGHPASQPGHGPLVLGAGVVIRAYAVLYVGTVIGPRTAIGHGALVREGNVVGADCSIGSGAHLEVGNRIGDRSRVHSGCFLASATLATGVFCGPSVVFTNDPHPPCPRYEDCVGGATIEEEASIGAGVVLLPGITVGRRAVVGAGAVVTRSVAPGDVVAGNPARPVGRREELTCQAGLFPRAYAWDDQGAPAGIDPARSEVTS